jgi:hypothetical protein
MAVGFVAKYGKLIGIVLVLALVIVAFQYFVPFEMTPMAFGDDTTTTMSYDELPDAVKALFGGAPGTTVEIKIQGTSSGSWVSTSDLEGYYFSNKEPTFSVSGNVDRCRITGSSYYCDRAYSYYKDRYWKNVDRGPARMNDFCTGYISQDGVNVYKFYFDYKGDHNTGVIYTAPSAHPKYSGYDAHKLKGVGWFGRCQTCSSIRTDVFQDTGNYNRKIYNGVSYFSLMFTKLAYQNVKNPIYIKKADGWYIKFDVPSACQTGQKHIYGDYIYECVDGVNVKRTSIELQTITPNTYQYGTDFTVRARLAGFEHDQTNVMVTLKKSDGTVYQTFSGKATDITVTSPNIEGAAFLTIKVQSGDTVKEVTKQIEFGSPEFIVNLPTEIQYGNTFTVNAKIPGFSQVSLVAYVKTLEGTMHRGPYTGSAPEIVIPAPDYYGTYLFYITATSGPIYREKTLQFTVAAPQITVNVPDELLYGQSFKVEATVTGVTYASLEVWLKDGSGNLKNTYHGNTVDGVNIESPLIEGDASLHIIAKSGAVTLTKDVQLFFSSPDVSVTIPQTILFGESFNVDVTLVGYSNVQISIELRDEIGTPLSTHTGTTPRVVITNPTLAGQGSLHIKATIHGLTKTVNKPIYISPPTLIVNIPTPLRYKETFNVGVSLPGHDDIDVTVKLERRTDTGWALINSYAGKTPAVKITSPDIIGEARLVIIVNVGTELKEIRTVFFQQPKLVVSVSPDLKYGQQFTIYGHIEGIPDVALTIKIYDASGKLLNTYLGASPSITVPGQPVKGEAKAVVTGKKQAIEDTVEVSLLFTSTTPFTISYPSDLAYGKDFWVTITDDSNTITDIEIFLKDSSDEIVGRYRGIPPMIRVEHPTIQGTGKMQVIATTNANVKFEEEFTLYFAPVKMTVDIPIKFTVGQNFDIEVNIEDTDGVPVTVIIKDSKQRVVGTWDDTTPIVTISGPRLLGDATMVVQGKWEDIILEETFNIKFTGSPIIVTPIVENYVQYSNQPIEFKVKVQDFSGKSITPNELGGYYFTASLSNGAASIPAVDYQGDGVYRVVTLVTGNGEFRATMHYTYLGTTFDSSEIKIMVDPNSISVNTNDISPIAEIGQTKSIRFTVYDASGRKFEPDRININVRNPDGISVDQYVKNQLTEIEEGVYEFTYKFESVEKHTFEIQAESSGMDSGMGKASVAVGEPGSSTGGGGGATMPGLPIGAILDYWWVIAIIIGAIVIYVIKFRR